MSLWSIHLEKNLFTVANAQQTQMCWQQPEEAPLPLPGFSALGPDGGIRLEEVQRLNVGMFVTIVFEIAKSWKTAQ